MWVLVRLSVESWHFFKSGVVRGGDARSEELCGLRRHLGLVSGKEGQESALESGKSAAYGAILGVA